MTGPVLPEQVDPVLAAEDQVLTSRGPQIEVVPTPTVGLHQPGHVPELGENRDTYYTPLELARGLLGILPIREGDRVMEPSVGSGAWLQALAEAHPRAVRMAVDVDPTAPGLADPGLGMRHVGDFLAWRPVAWTARPHLVVGNPPYTGAEQHVQHALRVVDPGAGQVAMLLGIGFLAGLSRWASIYRHHRPRAVVIIPHRVAFGGRARDGSVLDGKRGGPRDNVFIWWDLGWSGPPITAWLDPETMTVPGLARPRRVR